MGDRHYILKDTDGGLQFFVFSERGSFDVIIIDSFWNRDDGANIGFLYSRDENEFLDLIPAHNIKTEKGMYSRKSLQKHLMNVIDELGIDEHIRNYRNLNRNEILNNFLGVFFEARAKSVVREMMYSDDIDATEHRNTFYSDGDDEIKDSKTALLALFNSMEDALNVNGRHEEYLEGFGCAYELLRWFEKLSYAEAFDVMNVNAVNLANYTLDEMLSIFRSYTAVSLNIDLIANAVLDVFYALDQTIYESENRFFN